ncbi:MAG: DUF423 domain-containing protein [Saprospiraceae bacterium]|nr:DUF423 domain-containing protein [Saprospiraceae bacterium]
MKNKNWLITAFLLCGLAVALGAFGAHGLKTRVSPLQIETFKTGVQYHFYHAFAIALAAIVSQFTDSVYVRQAMRLFLIGIVCFSGSLYGLIFVELTSTEGLRWLGAITPIGGVLFMAGWGQLTRALYQVEK